MAFGSFNQEDAPMAEINVTPLVDVMLVLLIVFMITMPVLTHSIPLQLPTSSEESNHKNVPKDPLRLSINAEGEYYLGENQISLSELAEQLTEAKAANEDVVLAVAADRSVAYEKVADALEKAQQAGVGKIGFIQEKEE